MSEYCTFLKTCVLQTFFTQFFTTQSLTGKCNPLKVIILEKPKIPEQNDCHLCEHFSVAQLQSYLSQKLTSD